MSLKQLDVIYHITFLGSDHLAKNYGNNYKPFNGKEKHVYYNDKIKSGNFHRYFVFSGPNAFDIGELSIKNISNKAITILNQEIKRDLEQIKKSNPQPINNTQKSTNSTEPNNNFDNEALKHKQAQIDLIYQFTSVINNKYNANKFFDPKLKELIEQVLNRANDYKIWLIKNGDIVNNDSCTTITSVLTIKIKITGHSRGGTIAQKVYDKLKSYFKYDSDIIKFNTLNKADEYSGGFNRFFRTDYDKHTLDSNLDSVQVVSMAPTVPFNSIAYNRNAKVTIFTTCSHGSCMAVAKAFRKHFQNEKGVYFHISDFYFKKGEEFKNQLNSLKKEEFFKISKDDLMENLKSLCQKLLSKNIYDKKYANLLKSKDKKLQNKKDNIEKMILMELIKKKISSRRYKIFEEELSNII